MNATAESAIDTSLSHYMEDRALAIALEKAATPAQRRGIEQLAALRQGLMQRRAAFLLQAVAARHARGEIYSKARVAAINSMGPRQVEMDQNVKVSYQRQPDAEGVLKAHARSHFVYGLVSARLLLASHTADIVEAARDLHRHEEAFASAWVDAIPDAHFKPELRRQQRQALAALRTSARPMLLVSWPAIDSVGGFDDLDAQALGKAWNKLDDAAQALGVEPLSNFIAVPGEDEAAGVEAARLLPTVRALLAAVQAPGAKWPAKRATVQALNQVNGVLLKLDALGGRACFEVDF